MSKAKKHAARPMVRLFSAAREDGMVFTKDGGCYEVKGGCVEVPVDEAAEVMINKAWQPWDEQTPWAFDQSVPPKSAEEEKGDDPAAAQSTPPQSGDDPAAGTGTDPNDAK